MKKGGGDVGIFWIAGWFAGGVIVLLLLFAIVATKRRRYGDE